MYLPVLVLRYHALFPEWTAVATIAGHHRDVAAETASCIGLLTAYDPHRMSGGTYKRTFIWLEHETKLIILPLFYRTTGNLRIIVGIFDESFNPHLLQPYIDFLTSISGVLDYR